MPETTVEAGMSKLPPRVAAATPKSIRRVAKVLWLMIVALPFALLLVPWQQNVRGEGRVVAYAPLERRQRVEAPIDGRITRFWVVEGSVVRKGEDLFEITDNDPRFVERLKAQIDAANAKLDAASSKLKLYTEQGANIEDSKKYALQAAFERIGMAKQRVRAHELAIDAAQIAFDTAELEYKRRKSLEADGLASTREYELGKLAIRRTRAELDSEMAALRAAQADQSARESELKRIDAEMEAKIRTARASQQSAASEEATAKASVLQLQTRLARQQTQRVPAPADGTVLRLFANQGGEMVKGGEPVVEIVPSTAAMAVELWVDGNDMPLLSTQRKVRLQFEGWPAVQFAGWPSVAVGTFGGIVQLIDVTDDGKGRFRVLIVPDPEEAPWPSRHYLRQGVQARGWIWLQRVTIGFELWRLLNGFPPVVSETEPAEAKK